MLFKSCLFASKSGALLAMVVLLVVIASARSARAIGIAAGGKAQCMIVTGDDATPAEQAAALELRVYLLNATGAMIEMRTEKDSSADAPQILVGPSARAKALLPNVDFAALGADGIVMKTVGPHLILAG